MQVFLYVSGTSYDWVLGAFGIIAVVACELPYRSEGLALTGYDIPGCVDDGAWMLWENSSVVVVAAVVAVAHPGLEKLFEFHYGIGPSGVRGSIRLVFRSTDARILLFFLVGRNQISQNKQKRSKSAKNRHSRKNPL